MKKLLNLVVSCLLRTAMVLSLLLVVSQSAEAATITVTTGADAQYEGTFFWAISQANGDGNDTIVFDIPTIEANGYTTEAGCGFIRIKPSDPNQWASLTQDNIIIDGSTQTTNRGDTNLLGPEIMLDGDDITDGDGIGIAADNCIVKNIISSNWTASGIFIDGDGGSRSGNAVWGCYLGMDASGEAGLPNNIGLSIENAGTGNYLGSTEAINRNIISGNSGASGFGVLLTGAGVSGNWVLGNYIGLTASGGEGPNSSDGIRLENGANGNNIGDATSGGRNIISWNGGDGIEIGASDSNNIYGNYIGTNPTGDGGTWSFANGIFITSSSANNNIGNGTAGGRNIISSSGGNSGIKIDAFGINNTVRGNYIGLNAAGDGAIANNQNGIFIVDGATLCMIGGTSAGEGNFISGNGQDGIRIENGSDDNRIYGNYIGLAADGLADLANGAHGIEIRDNSDGNRIGSSEGSGRNIIGNSGENGIHIQDSGSTNNIVINNYIGTTSDGATAAPNTNHGIFLVASTSLNTIGGSGANEGNVLSGNTQCGININGCDSNTVIGNIIGLKADGSGELANVEDGIFVGGGSASNVIGGTSAGQGNVLSGNGQDGIEFNGSGANEVYANTIGLNPAGDAAIPNAGKGIQILWGPSGVVVGNGSASGRNIISGNTGGGIYVNDDGSGTNNTIIDGNYIGVAADGTTIYDNELGIEVDAGGNTINGIIISNNTIADADDIGVDLYGGVDNYDINNNTVIGAGTGTGLQIGENGDPVNSGSVTTNEVRDWSIGINFYLDTGQIATFESCTVVRNDAAPAVGILVNSGTVDVKNSILSTDPTGATAPAGSFALAADGANSVANVSYTCSFGNDIDYSAVNGGTVNLSTGTIESNANFNNVAGNDFTLSSNSPCIDAGTPTGTDMGSYQYDQSTGGVPAVRVISPNGTESWEAGSAQTITWYASQDADGISSLTLSYSTDSGTSYTLITTESVNDGTYAWTLPIVNSTTCKISVEAITGNGQSIHGTDESDAVFTIYQSEFDGPAITVEAPNGGENIQGGASYNVTFSASDVTGIKANTMRISYSTDEGTSYVAVASGQSITSPYSWSVPSLNTDEARVKIEMQDTYNTWGTKESAANFTIDSSTPAAPSPVYPLTGTSTNDTTPQFSWTQSAGVSGTASFEVRIDGISVSTQDSTANYTPGSALTEASHTWDARSKNNAGVWGLWSTAQSFTVDATGPTAPTLLTPTNNSNTNDATPIFTWSAATDTGSGVASYEVRLAGTIVTTTSALTYTHATTLTDASYTWDVRAKDNAGNYGPYSTAWTFVLDTTQVDPTQISLNISSTDVPVDASIEATFPATMDSTSVEDAFSLDDGAGSSSVKAKAAVAGTFSWNAANTTMTFTPTANLNAGSAYSLGISTAAKDQFGNPFSSAYSASFTTAGGDTNPPTISIKVRDRAIINGDYIPSIPTFQITATDDQAITASGVTMRLDGTAVTLTTVSTTATTVELSYAPTTALADEGTMSHILTIEAADSAGNVATSEIKSLKVSDGTAKITGGVLTYPTKYSPLSGGVLKIGYQLSTDAQTSIYLISKFGVIHWTYKAGAASEGGKAGYNEVEFNGTSDTSRSTIPNGLYMIKVVSQNRVIGSGHVLVLD